MTPIEVVEATYAAFGRRDIPAALALADAQIQVSTPAVLPWGGPRVGHQELVRFLTTVGSVLDENVHRQALFTSGDQVVTVNHTTGTVRQTGKGFDSPEVHVWRVRNDMVCNFDLYIDTDQLLNALTD